MRQERRDEQGETEQTDAANRGARRINCGSTSGAARALQTFGLLGFFLVLLDQVRWREKSPGTPETSRRPPLPSDRRSNRQRR